MISSISAGILELPGGYIEFSLAGLSGTTDEITAGNADSSAAKTIEDEYSQNDASIR
jgi:hypothetical protein